MTINHPAMLSMIIGGLLMFGCASPQPGSALSPTATPSPSARVVASPAPDRASNDALGGGASSASSSPQPIGSASPNTGKAIEGANRATTQVSVAADEDSYTGFYEVAGALPADMNPFGNFMIRSVAGGRVSGAVVPDEGEVFEFTSATLAGGKLSFTTAKVAGVSYSFEGAFTATPPFAGGKKTPVIAGTLKKYRNAKEAGQADLKFYYDEGGGE